MKKTETARLLLVVNDPGYFLSHRLPIALAAKRAGYEVHVATVDGPAAASILAHDLYHHRLDMRRGSQNPWQELRALVSLYRLFVRLQPDIVHLVTIKPVLYGGLAARLTKVRAVVAAISGLGHVFTGKGLKAWLRRELVERWYRFVLNRPNVRVIFQNPDDRRVLLGVVHAAPENTILIRGSGVDLEAYSFQPEPDGVPVVVMAARLLKDKGVIEFVEVARQLRRNGVSARFWLVGAPDPENPGSVSDAALEAWRREGVVEILGHRHDIAALFAGAHVVVLPSSYGEGLPKVLQEAAACGRAIVTTDMPGCRDAVEPGVTGLLVPARDVTALAAAIRRLLEDDALRRRMGEAARRLAEREFAIDEIVSQHLVTYDALLKCCPARGAREIPIS